GASYAYQLHFSKSRVFENPIMPRRELLTSAQREELLPFPTEEVDLIRYYTFSAHDFAVIRRCRGGHNRLGFRCAAVLFTFSRSADRTRRSSISSDSWDGRRSAQGTDWCVELLRRARRNT